MRRKVSSKRGFTRKRRQLQNPKREPWRTRYLAHLESPQWFALRDKILKRDRWRCRLCGAFTPLHVHHITYARVCHEDLGDLVALCQPCHKVEHETIPITKNEDFWTVELTKPPAWHHDRQSEKPPRRETATSLRKAQ